MDKCNICWSNSVTLYNMCSVCTAGATCRRCIRKSLNHNNNNMICMKCPMCRSPSKVPDLLLKRYSLSLLDRLIMVLQAIFIEFINIVAKLAVKWNYMISRYNDSQNKHVLIFFSSIATMILINLVFYNMCWSLVYYMYGLTFFMNNMIVIVAFATYYYMLVSGIRIGDANKMMMYVSSMCIVIIYPHFLTLSIQLIDSMSINLIYGFATVGVFILSGVLISTLTEILLYSFDRWIDTGYRYSLERFMLT